MAPKRHPKKEIRRAIKEAQDAGWIIEPSKGGSSKAWGQLRCGAAPEIECRMTINSTPGSPENEAKKIRRKVAKCPHKRG